MRLTTFALLAMAIIGNAHAGSWSVSGPASLEVDSIDSLSAEYLRYYVGGTPTGEECKAQLEIALGGTIDSDYWFLGSGYVNPSEADFNTYVSGSNNDDTPEEGALYAVIATTTECRFAYATGGVHPNAKQTIYASYPGTGGPHNNVYILEYSTAVKCVVNQYLNNGVCTDCNAFGSVGYLNEQYSLNPNGGSLTEGDMTAYGEGNNVCNCIEVGQRVLMDDGTHKNIENLVPGDVLRTPTGRTTVRATRRGGRHLSGVHDVSCNGKTGAITGNHAYHCEGEWRLPQETHSARALTGSTEVVAVETDNYCEDRMILESGLHVETWDGRGVDEWRPHTYENGRRLRCTLKGSWRDRVLQRVDSKK